MKQIVEHFIQCKNHQIKCDDDERMSPVTQINKYLSKHPQHTVQCITYVPSSSGGSGSILAVINIDDS